MKYPKEEEKQYKQKGLTLTEVLIALMIAGVIIAGALAYYKNTMAAANTTQLMRDVTAIRSMTYQLYMGQGDYGSGNINEQLIIAQKIPSTMKTSGSTITTALGGNLVVEGEDTQFSITLTKVPKEICISMVTGLTDGWDSVQVNGGSQMTDFPIKPAQATSSSACGGSDNNTIKWTSSN